VDRLSGRQFGAYDLGDKLGSGGMGTVYRAVHRKLRQPRALKVLPPQLALDETFVERFEREATISAELRHPNIVLIHDFSEEDGFHYIAMELVAGVSLRELIQRESPVSLERALNLLGQLADALDYAHGRGVVHRDLKAANILVGANDHVTLLDFGLARALEGTQLTHTGVVVGTPEYLAPEMIAGAQNATGPSVDLYALGVIAFEILAGRLPFIGMDTSRLMFAHAYDTPPSVREFRPDLTPEIDAAVTRQLSKKPGDRYQSAGSFLAALRGEPESDYRVAAPARSSPHLPLRPPEPVTQLPRLGSSSTATPLPNFEPARAGIQPGTSSTALGARRRHALLIGKWQPGGNEMLFPRYLHVAGLLPSGKILVAGGSSGRDTFATVEVYDPDLDTWDETKRMSAARVRATLSTLADGSLLVVGGAQYGKAVATAEIYDPGSNAWRAVKAMADARHMHTATVLPNSRVLVAGGLKTGIMKTSHLATAEVLDPQTGQWSSAGRMNTGRSDHSATLTARGEVLLAGGFDGSRILATVELYEPATGAWVALRPMNAARARHTATLLPDGRVLVAGGADSNGRALATAEVYDGVTDTWETVEPMTIDREGHTASVLPNGQVLIAGGHDSRGAATSSSELFDPGKNLFLQTAWMNHPRRWHTATLLPNGIVVVIGGLDSANASLATVELF
jgi:serine/threonine protein kinase